MEKPCGAGANARGAFGGWVFEMWDFFREMGGLKCGVFFRGERCFFWGGERVFFEGEESPAGGGKRRVAFGG